ncbi:hypothetical protein BN1050_00295 [Metalysinibacillus saudimassiliensis]|uniref:VWA domain-containing protein n=1 Tax=Metalysinibacillus saudimassiliensis TaxID=1461583 RepID=A0A078M0K8_9BACL|nr:hypothetical protein BN1050_00295 [Metalysinibacillus saudimassiliensis]
MKNKQTFISVVLTLVLLITSFMPFVAEAATFSDVPANSGKYPAINWAVENGFMNGAGRFEPNATVKEGALVETLSRADEHYQQVQEADMRYLFYGEFNLPLKGYVNKSLRNATDVTRGDFARIFAAFRGYDLTEKHAVQYLYTQGVTTGVTGKKTYKDYQPERVLTKGDLAVFLYRAQQTERLAVKGLQLAAVGRDDSKVTLPPGFDGDTTTQLPPPTEQEGNDIVGSESSKGLVQEVRISKEELIANGVDRTMLEIKLQTCDLSPINAEKTHQFQVKSKFGAYAVDGEGKVTRNVYTDGDTIYAEIVAPQLTKSVRDTITFELVNNNDKAMSCFVGKKIEVPLRYMPKAEMRVTYDVWDPDQPEDDNTNVKPPAIITETSPEFFQDGLIDVYTIFEDYKFEIGQLTEFRDVLGEVKREYIHYGKNENAEKNALGYENAILKFENYPIALWLFDRMLHERVYEGVRYPAEVHYSQVDPLRPTYAIQGIDDVIASQAEQINAVAAIVQLMGYLPAEDKITLEHYDSIYSIWAIYENLGVKEKDVFLAYEKGKKLGQLEAYKKRVDALKESEIIANRPKEFERYTKVMVNLYMPGGEVITDYQGEVKVTFNGEERTGHFITNTSSALGGSGEPGTAVVYFDSVVYGESNATVEIVKGDKEYDKMLKDITGPQQVDIYTDPRFATNSCTRATEIGFVVDYSGSMQAVDPDNSRAHYVRKLIKQFDAENNIIVRADTTGKVIKKGKAKDVLTHSLFDNEVNKGGTNLLKATDVVFNHYTDSRQASKALIIISDGKTSVTMINQITKKAKDQGIKVYTIGMGEGKQLNDRTLVQLANDTGGTYFHALNRHQFHNHAQVLLNSVLCNRVYDSCAISNNLLRDPSVRVRNGRVTMQTQVDETCNLVDKVIVKYHASHGELQFTLGNRSNVLHTTTQPIAQFDNLILNSNVEFVALDKSGNVIARKNVTVQ